MYSSCKAARKAFENFRGVSVQLHKGQEVQASALRDM